jgi:hypothetical protein
MVSALNSRLVMPAEALVRAGYAVAHGRIGDISDRTLMQFDGIVGSRVGDNLDQAIKSIEGLQRLGKKVFVDYFPCRRHIDAWREELRRRPCKNRWSRPHIGDTRLEAKPTVGSAPHADTRF